MGVNPEFQKWSNILVALAVGLALAVALTMWSTVEYIKEENREGNKDRARDVGLYMLLVISGFSAGGMILCACSVTHPSVLSTYACFAFVSSLFFLIIAVTKVDDSDRSRQKNLFVGYFFAIGTLLFLSALAAFKVAKEPSFDPTYDEEHNVYVEPRPQAALEIMPTDFDQSSRSRSTNDNDEGGRPRVIHVEV